MKSLPPRKLEQAASYLHQLKLVRKDESRVALDRAFGCLTPAEADEMEHAIAANCEKVDADQW